MKTPAMVFFNTAGLMILLLAVYHCAGYVFGWTQFREGDLPPTIIGGISGALGGWIAVRRMNKRKAQQTGQQPL